MWRDSMKVADEEKAKRDRIIDDYKQVKTPFIVLKLKANLKSSFETFRVNSPEKRPTHITFGLVRLLGVPVVAGYLSESLFKLPLSTF